MRPLTEQVPKPMLTVLGKPLIQYTFEAMPDAVDTVVVVVGYRREHIMNFLGSTFLKKRVEYVVQDKPGGTAEALELARSALGTGQFLKFYGDDIYQKADVARLFDHHYSILLGQVANPRAFGVVSLAPDGRIQSFEEKPEEPKSNLVSAGVMLLDERVFSYVSQPKPSTGERYDVDMVMGLAHDHAVYGVSATRWIQIGYPEDLAKAERVLSQS